MSIPFYRVIAHRKNAREKIYRILGVRMRVVNTIREFFKHLPRTCGKSDARALAHAPDNDLPRRGRSVDCAGPLSPSFASQRMLVIGHSTDSRHKPRIKRTLKASVKLRRAVSFLGGVHELSRRVFLSTDLKSSPDALFPGSK